MIHIQIVLCTTCSGAKKGDQQYDSEDIQGKPKLPRVPYGEKKLMWKNGLIGQNPGESRDQESERAISYFHLYHRSWPSRPGYFLQRAKQPKILVESFLSNSKEFHVLWELSDHCRSNWNSLTASADFPWRFIYKCDWQFLHIPNWIEAGRNLAVKLFW